MGLRTIIQIIRQYSRKLVPNERIIREQRHCVSQNPLPFFWFTE